MNTTGFSRRDVQRVPLAGRRVFPGHHREGPTDLQHPQRPPHPVEDPLGVGRVQALALLLLSITQSFFSRTGTCSPFIGQDSWLSYWKINLKTQEVFAHEPDLILKCCLDAKSIKNCHLAVQDFLD